MRTTSRCYNSPAASSPSRRRTSQPSPPPNRDRSLVFTSPAVPVLVHLPSVAPHSSRTTSMLSSSLFPENSPVPVPCLHAKASTGGSIFIHSGRDFGEFERKFLFGYSVAAKSGVPFVIPMYNLTFLTAR